MKWNRKLLRKMILNEMKLLNEMQDMSYLYGKGFSDRATWPSVGHKTIQASFKASGMDPISYFKEVQRHGYDWQLPKVAAALSEIDPSFYEYANQNLGTQLYSGTGNVKIPTLAPNQMGGLEDDYSDDYDDDDDIYPGPLVP